MKSFIEYLNEALEGNGRRRTTKTKTAQPKFGTDLNPPPAQPLSNYDQPSKPNEPAQNEPLPNINRASAADTRRAASIEPTDQMRDMLGRMRDIEIDPDLPDYPEQDLSLVPVTTETLPAVAGQALVDAGKLHPTFHQVANLPGNMQREIRQLGRSLFGSMTRTPTSEIYMVGDVGGQGPNTSREVNAVAGFLKTNGEKIGPGNIDFSGIMPGYTADTFLFRAAGIRWLLVKDFAGEYIYCWPESDSLDTAVSLGNERKRLK
jgi:hypothetical protein